jgi:hypothetical protein
MSRRASDRKPGHRQPKTAAAAMQITPPPATVAGAPQRAAVTPLTTAPSGAMPMNIIE